MIIDDMMEYKNSLEKAIEYGKKICMEFETALKPIIPDIKVHLGGIESGIDVVTFDSESHKSENFDGKDYMLQIIAHGIFPELPTDTDFGCYISQEEAKKVKAILKKLRNGNASNLMPFCDENTAHMISSNFSQDEIMELVGILKFIKENYKEYGKPILVPKYEDEKYEATPVIAYIDIVLDNCGWGEWEDLEMVILEREVLLKGKVAVVCIKGLTEAIEK